MNAQDTNSIFGTADMPPVPPAGGRKNDGDAGTYPGHCSGCWDPCSTGDLFDKKK